MQENYTPLDIRKLKEVVRQESARLNLRSFSVGGESSFTLSLALSAAIKKIFFERGPGAFDRKEKSNKPKEETNDSELFEQIGRLKMEVEWLKKKLGNLM